MAEYASLLGITPNYLNVLCRKHLGLSALRMIDSRIVLEIKRLLMENEKTKSEIAYSLGFYELSYFSRFFRRMEGVSPAERREVLEWLLPFRKDINVVGMWRKFCTFAAKFRLTTI